MALPKNVLFPVDFSERCHAAWPAIAAMARRLGVPVTQLHVLDLDRFELPDVPGGFTAIRRHFLQKLEHFTDEGSDLPGLRRELAEGDVARCIIQRAENMEAPLIMMPTAGRTRFRQLLLGSVTASVLHDAACPVWTEAHSEGQPPDSGECRSVLCAIDLGPQSAAVLLAARELSLKGNASFHLVHSVPGIDPRFPSLIADRAHAFLIAKAREDFAALRVATGVDLPLTILEEVGLVDGIVGAVRGFGANLLVIGRGVSQGTLGRLRTNAHRLIRHSPCAVVSV
jgi:nucleotide-binding universal stress UspA family protein